MSTSSTLRSMLRFTQTAASFIPKTARGSIIPVANSNRTNFYSSTSHRKVIAAKSKGKAAPKVTVTKSSSTPGTESGVGSTTASESLSNAATNQNESNDTINDSVDDVDETYGKFKLPNIEKEVEIRKKQLEVRSHYEHGQYDVALECSKELLEITQDHFGHDHPATAAAYNQIGLMYKELGKFKDSKKHYHESLRIYERVVGKDHASYAAALHNVGNLHKSQVYLDDKLSKLDRIQLNEVAIEYLEEAFNIRKVELGIQHPHTVASQSSLGSTIATQVLQQQELSATSASQQKIQNKPISTRLTKKRWELAETHLRASLQIAIDNPRGESILSKKDDKDNNSSTTCNATAKSDKKDLNESHRARKHQKGRKKKDSSSSQSSSHVVVEHRGKVTTLSAATASQNLAVFLKCRAISILPTNSNSPVPNNIKTLYHKLINESKYLYEQSLLVRSTLLFDEQHPDIVTTKHSLAELLSTCFNDEDSANKLRNEIIDSHDVVEVNADSETSDNMNTDDANKNIGSSISSSTTMDAEYKAKTITKNKK